MPTHGSITKAGKVRSQTPKIPPRPRTYPPPRVSFKNKYRKRYELGRKPGQVWINSR
ncbi:MAG: 30S ribosomal protein S30e [Nitrososphaeria archaeon]|jgi:small subunit ribosomal protein S30e